MRIPFFHVNLKISFLLPIQPNLIQNHIIRPMIHHFLPFFLIVTRMLDFVSKRQTMRQSLKSTPPIIGDVASCIRPEDYLTMA